MKWAVWACAALVAGCGAGVRSPTGPVSATRSACPGNAYWNGAECQPRGDGATSIDAGAEALAAFQVEEALRHLERARKNGPHRRADYLRIFEQLGIAHSYLGAEDEALAAFEMLLALDPGHLLSYTLSPKATFVFERARNQASQRPTPALDLSWPRGLEVSNPVPVDVEVIADPGGFLHAAAIHVRRKGDATFRAVDVPLPAMGEYRRVLLPPLDSTRPEVLQVYVTAVDARRNEVLTWASPERPREIELDYRPPAPWYRKWWVWATVGAVVAAGTGASVYALTREPPDTVGGNLTFDR